MRLALARKYAASGTNANDDESMEAESIALHSKCTSTEARYWRRFKETKKKSTTA